MNASTRAPALLRRIARLEATLVRLNQDLGSLRDAVSRQELQPPRRPGAQSSRASAEPVRPDIPAAGGLAGALARGEAARVRWVRQGLVVPGEQLAQAWGLTRQALAPAAQRGEIFCVKVGNRLYYPQAFLQMDRQAVAAICRALGELGTSEKLAFWMREHGALAGRSIGAAMEAGTSLARVESLAAAWAAERGALRVAAAA